MTVCVYADLFELRVPHLRVGALDTILKMSDELSRLDSSLQGFMRKAERQVSETSALVQHGGSSPGSAAASGGSSKPTQEVLYVDDMTVEGYLETYEWDSQQWDEMEGLVRLSELLSGAAEAADKDMHRYAKAYGDHMARISFMEKGRTGTLATAPLEPVLTAQLMQSSGLTASLADTEFLQTVLVVVPKAAEDSFFSQYEGLDAVSVPVTDASGAHVDSTSPVVPRSALHILTERDYALFSVTILRKFFDSVTAAAKKNRWVVRSVDWSAAGVADTAEQLSRMHADASSALQLWAAAAHRTFASLLSIQVHLKVLQAFVEAVLSYGLPAQYSYCLLRVHHATARQAAEAVKAATGSSGSEADAEESAADAAFLASNAAPTEGNASGPKESDPAAALAYSLPCVAVPLVTAATVQVGR